MGAHMNTFAGPTSGAGDDAEFGEYDTVESLPTDEDAPPHEQSPKAPPPPTYKHPTPAPYTPDHARPTQEASPPDVPIPENMRQAWAEMETAAQWAATQESKWSWPKVIAVTSAICVLPALIMLLIR